MARTVPTGLQPLLDLPSCGTQTTLDLTLEDTSVIRVATSAFTVDGRTYTKDLRKGGQLKQSILTPPDRCQLIIQNVDKVFGGYVTDEDLVNAVGVIGRYYTDDRGNESPKWVELFQGTVFPMSITELQVEIEVLGDLVAAGFCVGEESLAENCQSVFKGPLCGYAGLETTCNKKKNSPAGCSGKNWTHRFNGMEYPDIQTASPDVTATDPVNPDQKDRFEETLL